MCAGGFQVTTNITGSETDFKERLLIERSGDSKSSHDVGVQQQSSSGNTYSSLDWDYVYDFDVGAKTLSHESVLIVSLVLDNLHGIVEHDVMSLLCIIIINLSDADNMLLDFRLSIETTIAASSNAGKGASLSAGATISERLREF
ncbi:hypothetical protein UCDDA912_g02445 [Diaporthe ampelina]|uniref:Uncharacterized protein n=1 Tax=Diaporthe ampelina TaxID=1214573 RepID=A0A0G2FU84_9PEZI|nr:hypothetical protein UCDDA912_g02445 [Diaporthe ampelina]